jgi:hypothetical protein
MYVDNCSQLVNNGAATLTDGPTRVLFCIRFHDPPIRYIHPSPPPVSGSTIRQSATFTRHHHPPRRDSPGSVRLTSLASPWALTCCPSSRLHPPAQTPDPPTPPPHKDQTKPKSNQRHPSAAQARTAPAAEDAAGAAAATSNPRAEHSLAGARARSRGTGGETGWWW